MEAGGSLMEHNRFFNKFGGDIQKIFSKCAKCKIDAVNLFGGPVSTGGFQHPDRSGISQ
jgi:hypothetical protein